MVVRRDDVSLSEPKGVCVLSSPSALRRTLQMTLLVSPEQLAR